MDHRYRISFIACLLAAALGGCPDPGPDALLDVADEGHDATTADATVDSHEPDGTPVPDTNDVAGDTPVAGDVVDDTTSVDASADGDGGADGDGDADLPGPDVPAQGAAPFVSDDFGGYVDEAAMLAAPNDASGDPEATFEYFAMANGTVTLEQGDTPTGSGQFLRITYDPRDPAGGCGQDASGTGTSLNIQAAARNTDTELWLEASMRWPDGAMWDGSEGGGDPQCYNEVKLALPVAQSTRLSAYQTTVRINHDYPGAPDTIVSAPYAELGWEPYTDAMSWKRIRFHYRVNGGQGDDVWEMWGDAHDGNWILLFRSDTFDFSGESMTSVTFVEYLNERGIAPWRVDIAAIRMWDESPGWTLP